MITEEQKVDPEHIYDLDEVHLNGLHSYDQ